MVVVTREETDMAMVAIEDLTLRHVIVEQWCGVRWEFKVADLVAEGDQVRVAFECGGGGTYDRKLRVEVLDTV